MNHWSFIIPAYAAVLLGVGGLLVASWRAMVAAERAAGERD
jgi:hypothetical protein